ncbi:MAG: helix-turn-helix transcriptional regulator [Acidobacteriota bacterium]
MADEPTLTHTATMILKAIDTGYAYGFSVMEVTGLPSGTVYPAMRRLERDDLISSSWEKQKIADSEQRPARKYYTLTRSGKTKLAASQKRYPLLARLIPVREGEPS